VILLDLGNLFSTIESVGSQESQLSGRLYGFIFATILQLINLGSQVILLGLDLFSLFIVALAGFQRQFLILNPLLVTDAKLPLRNDEIKNLPAR